jgi:hypothetical protein
MSLASKTNINIDTSSPQFSLKSIHAPASALAVAQPKLTALAPADAPTECEAEIEPYALNSSVPLSLSESGSS